MAENALYEQQEDLYELVGNKYNKNWGTLMSFLGIFINHLLKFLKRG